MKRMARSISPAICSYFAYAGFSVKPLFHSWTSRRSAKPPCVKARIRLSVAAEVWYASSSRSGSGARSSAREADAVDDVAPVRRKRDAVARLVVGRARLGVLAGHAADLDDGQARAVGEDHGHLQDRLDLVADPVGRRLCEGLGAVAALENERLAARQRPRGDRAGRPPRRRTRAEACCAAAATRGGQGVGVGPGGCCLRLDTRGTSRPPPP